MGFGAIGPSAVARRATEARDFLKRLAAIPAEILSPQDRLSARLLRYQIDNTIGGEELQTYLLRVSQMNGMHAQIFNTLENMPTRNERDYRNIIARLRAIPAFVDQNIALMNIAISRGMVQPKLVTTLIIGQLATQVSQDAPHTSLLAGFQRFSAAMPATMQQELRAEANEAYESQFRPAWRKLHAYMRDVYLPKAREETSIAAIPNGKQAYAYMVRSMTTTTRTPEEIHKLGESEVKRIEGEMAAIMREAGFSGSLSEFEEKLKADPAQHFADKEDMLAYCRNIAKIVEPELPRLFKNVPGLLYGIRAIPADREAATASNASPGAPDGSRPAWFNLNAYRPEVQLKYNKQALVLHEAVPGHIFQGTIRQHTQGLPEFRKIYGNSAYNEGWGLYAESLGSDLGVYKDPYSRFGRLESERFRAVRLVVDTGLHAYGWTRASAVDYFQTHAPAASLAEIDRYIAWPGQALAYKSGELKITELRHKAEKALGSRFDIRDFHDVVLRNGALPLELLEEQVDHYIGSR
jgi:uncharacterized protein (DUF885 family)